MFLATGGCEFRGGFAVMGGDGEHGQDSNHTEERFLAMKPPTSPRSALRSLSSRNRRLQVDVSRLSLSGTVNCTHPPLYSPLASPFAPDPATKEVDWLLLIPASPHCSVFWGGCLWLLCSVYVGEIYAIARENECRSVVCFNACHVLMEDSVIVCQCERIFRFGKHPV